LTVQIEAWSDDSRRPRQWTETSTNQAKAVHVVGHLQPGATYDLKTNGSTVAVLRANEAGRVEFKAAGGNGGAQTFELASP